MNIGTKNYFRKNREFFYFTAVGVFNTLFNVVIFDILLFSGLLNSFWSNFVSLLVSVTISYFINKYWVFREKSRFRGTQLFYFALGTFIIQLAVQHTAVWSLGEVYTVPGEIIYNMLVMIGINFEESFVIFNTAKILGVVLSMFITYFFYDKLIFAARKKNLNGNE